jgi:hypothetical protein
MAKLRCNTCQGEYEDRTQDGVRYFHACPPIVNPAFDPRPTIVNPVTGVVVRNPAYSPRDTIERLVKRDENIVQLQRDGEVEIKAPGRGTTKLED